MRSIGRKNIRLVKEETENAIRVLKTYDYLAIERYVISKLPESLWDIWEGADQEIRNIIGSQCYDSASRGY